MPTQHTTHWSSIAPAVFERLRSAPSSRTHDSLRWGSRGSLALYLETGTWQDYESGEGGGLLSFVERELGTDRAGALNWLEREGFLPGWRENDGIRHGPRKPHHDKSQYSHVTKRTNARSERSQRKAPRKPGREVGVILDQSMTISHHPEHPARLWANARNLWKPDEPLPSPLRWIPARARWFERRHHDGAGAIIAPIAPLAEWRKDAPDTPTPYGLQLVNVDAEGKPALQGGLNKRTHGRLRGLVFALKTDADPDLGVIVCEGVADALAIAARFEPMVVAALTTPGIELAPAIAATFRKAWVFADSDKDGGGGKKAVALAYSLAARDVEAWVEYPALGKDWADTSSAIGWTDEAFLRPRSENRD